MKNRKISVIILLLIIFRITQINAQTVSASNTLVAQPITDRTVTFSITGTGVSKPVIWGLDLAWLWDANILRGIAFMGADKVDIVRSSFTPTDSLVNGDLQTAELKTLNQRLAIMDSLDSKTVVMLNCDHPSVSSWYKGNAAHWAQLMDVTTRRVQEHGRNVVSIAPFNEPDNSVTGQGTIEDFYNIAGELRKNPRFDNIRICGGNTLNNDQALSWYNTLNGRLDEGNTHQLAGSFDNYASFYQAVRASGNHATNDELHNVMEAMVGVEYGMQTGIWWGTAELARGEFVKASYGKRLGYAEHRPNWTAASVYSGPDGKVQAFGGMSERQAVTTTYRFFSKDRDVFYDGNGPQREYTMVLPGGTGYQQGQTNAERVVNVTWGDDIQPVVNGRYVLVNRNSGKVLKVSGGSLSAGASLVQAAKTGAAYQQWNVTPVDSRVGGDFSYFAFSAVHSGKFMRIADWSLENNGKIYAQDDDPSNAFQQWYLDYAGDGWFYIRSGWSAKCLDVADASTAEGATIVQWEKKGGNQQQWRFLPVGAAVEFNAPTAPDNLTAMANAVSIRLDWSASTETDVAGYAVFRSEKAGGPYNTIARNVKSKSFVDNTTITGVKYFYSIKAVDSSLNRSTYSNEASAAATGNKGLIACLQFDGNTLDSTINLNHGASYGETSFVGGKVGSKAIALNGTDAFVQLPANLANHKEISIAAWVFWRGGSAWQRIFDFGNSEDENMFLTPSSGLKKFRFVIKNGGAEQGMDTVALPVNKWSHVAVTLGDSGAYMYLNGELILKSKDIALRPLDFKPALNYIGRSQFPDPLFNGYIDDFMVYNYALSADEVALVAGNVVTNLDEAVCSFKRGLSLRLVPENGALYVNYLTQDKNISSKLLLFEMNGKVVMSKDIKSNCKTKLDISNLSAGIYMVKFTNSGETLMKKFTIR